MATPVRGIVTPEAVVLDFDTAGIASSALARAIDTAIQGALLFVLILVAVTALGGSGWLAVVVVITGSALVVLGYPVITELAMRGRSPGKATLGLRVVTMEGAPISPRHAFVRSAVGIIDFLLIPGGLIAVVVALFSPRSQRLGDVFAGTIVLRERTAARPAVAVWFNAPTGLEGYAATLDVSAVTGAQFALVRSYLLRLPDLSPEARASLSVRMATPLVEAMHHHTPPGVHADSFLQCVAAAYQRRHTDVPGAQLGSVAAIIAAAPPPPPPRAGGAATCPAAPGCRRIQLPAASRHRRDPLRQPTSVSVVSALALPRPRREHSDAPRGHRRDGAPAGGTATPTRRGRTPWPERRAPRPTAPGPGSLRWSGASRGRWCSPAVGPRPTTSLCGASSARRRQAARSARHRITTP